MLNFLREANCRNILLSVHDQEISKLDSPYFFLEDLSASLILRHPFYTQSCQSPEVPDKDFHCPKMGLTIS